MINKNEVIYKYKHGQDTRSIALEMNCSQRYIQQIVEESAPTMRRYGRSRLTKIFTVEDLFYCMQNPKLIEQLIQERYKEYYIKTNKKLINYDINATNTQSRRNKLRAIVLERDGFKCVDCGSSVALEVHHKKPVKDFPELEFDLDNCITLCRSCHREIPI
jgi:hypothetical protein